MAFSSWASGTLSETYGVSNALLVMMGVQTVGLLIGAFFRLPEVGNLNLDLVGRWREPSVTVEVEPRNGPIRVAVQYEIAQSDIPAFITAMNERRRVRRRDGAKNWTLSRDLADPEIWIEQYQFARWADYTLHNQRRTYADDDSLAAIKALHKGAWPPVIHRYLERPVNSFALTPPPPVDKTIDPTREG
jgi:hypothetical protein